MKRWFDLMFFFHFYLSCISPPFFTPILFLSLHIHTIHTYIHTYTHPYTHQNTNTHTHVHTYTPTHIHTAADVKVEYCRCAGQRLDKRRQLSNAFFWTPLWNSLSRRATFIDRHFLHANPATIQTLPPCQRREQRLRGAAQPRGRRFTAHR